MRRPGLYTLLTRFAPIGQAFHPLVKGTALDPARTWTETREFPEAAPTSFRDQWRARKAGAK
jgi:hypothetical protein